MIRISENVHMHWNPEKHSKRWRLSWFRYETFITFMTFRFSTRREIDTQFLLCRLFHQNQQPMAHLVDPQMAWPRWAPKINSPRLSLILNSLHFFKIPKNPSTSLPGLASFTSLVLFPIRGFYYDICDCHMLPARAWTPALNVCPYPCTKPKSSKPN